MERIGRGRRRAVLPALLAAAGFLSSCGEASVNRNAAPHPAERLSREEIERRWLPAEPVERPYRTLVAELAKLPLEERMAYYLEVTGELRDYGKYSSRDKECFAVLMEELVEQRDLAVLERLVTKLNERVKKDTLWRRLSSWCKRELRRDPGSQPGREAKRLLEEWAERHPNSIVLMEYRPNAVELYLAILEDTKNSAERRILAVGYLGEIGGADILPRLQKYADDPDLYRGISARGGGGPSVGEKVRRAIERIESRTAAGGNE